MLYNFLNTAGRRPDGNSAVPERGLQKKPSVNEGFTD